MFHWICPECGREIPPTVKECQVCDPNAVVLPIVEPVEAAPVAVALPVPPPVPAAPAVNPEVTSPEPVATAVERVVDALPALNLQPQPEPALPVKPKTGRERVVELKPEPAPQEALEVANPISAAPEPVAEIVPPAEIASSEPAPVEIAEPTAVAEPLAALAPPEPEIVAAAEPVVVAEPEPVVASAPPEPEMVAVGEPVPAAEPGPVAAVEPPEPEIVAVTEQVPVAEPEPVVAAAPPEPEVVAIEPALPVQAIPAEPVIAAAPTPEPVAEAAPPEPQKPELLAAPEPIVETAPVVRQPEPVVAEAPIKIEEVPDPLFALASEIRAVQAARAAALVAPQESAGIRELAEAVGIQPLPTPEAPAPVALAEPVAPVQPVASARQPEPVAQIVATVPQTAQAVEETPVEATAVALLVPPEEKTVPQVVAAPIAPAPEPEGPTLPFAPMQSYTPATNKSIQPKPPQDKILAADSGPRITLPGPTLPPELTRLQDANIVTLIGEKTEIRAKEALAAEKKSGPPGWLVTVGVMLVLLAAGLSIVSYLMPHTVADAKPAPTPAAAASTPAPTGPVSPLSKFIEVTGFRIVVDANKKSEVQYLVVNHSDADIADANVFITLRSAKPGTPPVCRFSFKVPTLGPFESKEMSSPIEKSTRAVVLPDWQDLRSDVQISQ